MEIVYKYAELGSTSLQFHRFKLKEKKSNPDK
jgi:hypothetical protein